MSNSSIAAYPVAQGQACVEFICSQKPEWRVALNPERFDRDANVMVLENITSTVVWLRFPQADHWELYSGIAALLKSSWLHVMFQEHVVWEYNLHDDQGGLLDRFEPLPQMWGHETPRIGNAEKLAQLWQINTARIRNYLKPRSDRLRNKKAYICRDQFRYGQFEQGYDFLTALTCIHFPEV